MPSLREGGTLLRMRGLADSSVRTTQALRRPKASARELCSAGQARCLPLRDPSFSQYGVVVVGESTSVFQAPLGRLPHTITYLALVVWGLPCLSLVVSS